VLGLAPRHFQQFWRNKIVKQDDISGLQRPHGLERQQFRVTRTGTDQRHTAPRWLKRHLAGISRQPLLGDLLRPGGACKNMIDKALPECAPLLARLKRCANMRAYAACKIGPTRQRLGQQGFDAPANGLPQNGGRAIRGNAYNNG